MVALFKFRVRLAGHKQWSYDEWYIIAKDSIRAVELLKIHLGEIKYKLVESSINLIIDELDKALWEHKVSK